MESSDSSSSRTELPPSSSPDSAAFPLASPSSLDRLWRPAAQRNLRNQWSKLASCTREWDSLSSSGKSHATDLVNAHLSRTYMPDMNLGVLRELGGVLSKSCSKLSDRQERSEEKLASSYSEMIVVLKRMIEAAKSMRSFKKSTNGARIVRFSPAFEGSDHDDSGDCGGIRVFGAWDVEFFEKMAWELVQMYLLEIKVKRIVLAELVSLRKEEGFCWNDEVYTGEFADLDAVTAFSDGKDESDGSESLVGRRGGLPRREVLEFYLAAWLVEANVDTRRVEEIFVSVSHEMNVRIF